MVRRGSKLGQSVLDLIVDDSQFTAGLDKNKRKAQSWTDSLNKDVKKGIAQGLGIAGGLGVASAVAAGIDGVKAVVAGSISAAMEWESAFAGVRKTVDASEEEFAQLSGAIRGMAKEIPIGTTELAGLAEAAGALGIAKKDIMEFTRVTALIGTTTDVSSDQAATSLGQLSNVLGLTNEDYERFGSTLVDLGNKGASTESQILEIAARAGAGSKLIGMASDQTLAWASSVANLGIEVEAGGTALQKFFLDSTKAVAEGGDKLETYARIAGTTGAEFKRAFEEDASGALQTFLAGLGELSQGDQLKALADLDFNDARITRTLLGLAGNTDNLSNSLDVASEAWEANIALAAEAEKRFGTTESKLKILGNRVNDLAITFGDDLLPAVVDTATVGVEQLEMFAEEVGSLVDFVGRGAQAVAGHFGDMGDATNKLADEMDKDFGEVNAAVTAYVADTGASFDEAIAAVRAYGTGNTAAIEESGRAWELYQKQIAGAATGATSSVEEGVLGIEGALLAGEGPIGDAAEVALDPVEEAARKAREEAAAHMSEMLKSIAAMFESDESVRDAMQGLMDRMDDPYTEAERKADIFSNDTLALIKKALDTDDPGAVAATTEFVNRILGEFALMEPGALETGGAVPPALREGMDAEMAALIDYIENDLNIRNLAALELDAVPAGLEAIASYARGMQRNALVATAEARNIALRTKESLQINAYGGGYATGASFVSGVTAAFWAKNPEVVTALNYMKRQLGGSLPEIGPLAGDTAARGGDAIGSDWIAHIASSIGDGLTAIERQVGDVGAALVPNLGPMVAPSMSGLAGLESRVAGASGNGAAGADNVTYQWILNVEGVPRTVGSKQQAIDELERIGETWG